MGEGGIGARTSCMKAQRENDVVTHAGALALEAMDLAVVYDNGRSFAVYLTKRGIKALAAVKAGLRCL